MENRKSQTEQNSESTVIAGDKSEQTDDYNLDVALHISSDQTSPATCRADIDE
ncbi:hypothetical protein ACFQZT_00430 [Paenibacillus sp. GCM10027628]|uniref:hypothetical protein n=1 Tax=Paenibacillus sp. GCM10027628 TaxID=3273413 RepID=UPI00362BA261